MKTEPRTLADALDVEREREQLRMTPRFLAQGTGKTQMPLTEMRGGVPRAHTPTHVYMHTSCYQREGHRLEVRPWPPWKQGQGAEPQALTDTQHYEGRVLPAGQQQEVDQVVGHEAEAQDHAAPLLEALACGERKER